MQSSVEAEKKREQRKNCFPPRKNAPINQQALNKDFWSINWLLIDSDIMILNLWLEKAKSF